MELYYLDYVDEGEEHLAELFKKVPSHYSLFEDPEVFFLKTCHRIEFYSLKKLGYDPIFDILGQYSQYEDDAESILTRLISIAVGLKSKINGEKFIFEQVKLSLKDSASAEVKSLIQYVLDTASEIRHNHNYFAMFDYDDIVSELILNDAVDARNCLVVGGGMLAQRIYKKLKPSSFLDKTCIITRNVKNLKKALRFEVNAKKDVVLLENVPDGFFESHFLCVIASSIEGAYGDDIGKVIHHKNCTKIIDLSSYPIFQNSLANEKYITMYHEDFNKIVITNNRMLDLQSNEVMGDISKHAQNYLNTGY